MGVLGDDAAVGGGGGEDDDERVCEAVLEEEDG